MMNHQTLESTERRKVLIVDDEPTITRALRASFLANGYDIRTAHDGIAALNVLEDWRPDLVITDLAMPDIDGIELCQRVRSASSLPIILLSVRGDVDSKIKALDAGADDYVTKPFSTPELLARLRAAQRKTRPEEEISVFKNGDLVVDLTARIVTRAGHEIKLTATVYALLRLFVKHPGRVLTHRYILREIWGPKSEEHRQYLRVYVTHLRQKIEADPARPSLISTQPGIGYRFAG